MLFFIYFICSCIGVLVTNSVRVRKDKLIRSCLKINSLNIIFLFQAVGVLMIFFSSDYQEAAAAVIVTSLFAKYFPDSLIRKIQGYW